MPLQYNKECYFCGSTEQLHRHHIFSGTSNRKNSELYKDACVVWLCYKHHNGSNAGVHFNRLADISLKQDAQKYFEQNIGTREQFRQIFGKSFI